MFSKRVRAPSTFDDIQVVEVPLLNILGNNPAPRVFSDQIPPPNPPGVGELGARQRGGAKINFTILTKGWGIKSRVFKSVDSESGRTFTKHFGPPWGRPGARGGAKMNFPILIFT